MKKYFYLAILVIIGVLTVTTISQCSRSKKYKALYEKELQNVEAYEVANSGLNEEVVQFKRTMDELQASKDSIDRKLMSVMKELKIAKNKVEEMQYQESQMHVIDTVVISDTIFIKNTDIDTTVGDEWYNMNIKLQYPSTVITEPTFNSEQYIYIYNEKKYVGGKSKCFFINWFKKTYTATEVKIEEKNPYIKTTNHKFIKIDKDGR